MTARYQYLATAALCVIGATFQANANDVVRNQVAANVVAADANADGALTLDEFTTLIDLNAQSGIGRAKMIQRSGRYETVFGRIDSNADGSLTRDEIQSIAAHARQ